MPNQRQRRARRVVNGMAAEDPAPQSKRFSVKNTTNTTLGMEGGETDEEVRAVPVTYRNARPYPGTKKDDISTLLFQRRPPITEREKQSYQLARTLLVSSNRNTGLTLVQSG